MKNNLKNSTLYFPCVSDYVKRGGFSLIELLFAIVFLSVIILASIKIQTGGIRLGNTHILSSQAYFIANQGMEIAEVLGVSECDHICTKYISVSTGGDYILSDTAELLIYDTFLRRIEIDNTGLTGAYLATVIVWWDDTAGSHSVEVKRIINEKL